MTILIDTNVFCAYGNSSDVHHKHAKKIIEDIVANKYGKGVITDYIFDETVTVALRKTDKKNAIELGTFLLNSQLLLMKIDPLIFKRAWELFQTTHTLSFTDCTNVALMYLFRIKKIATFDHGFKTIKDIDVIDT